MKNCPKCGAPLTQIDDERYKCENCNVQYKWVQKQPAETRSTAPTPNIVQMPLTPVRPQPTTSYAGHSENRPMSATEIRISAHDAISGHYGFAILTSILLNLVKYGSILFTAIFGPLLIGGMTKCSLAGFYLDVANGRQSDISSSFRGFKYLGKTIIAQLILGIIKAIVLGIIIALFFYLFTNTFGWISLVLLFVIIVIFVLIFIWTSSVEKLTYFLMIEHDEMTGEQCFGHAFRMVTANLGKFITLNLGFLGWAILIVLTFGILILFVDPYYQTAYAKMYMHLKNTYSFYR